MSLEQPDPNLPDTEPSINKEEEEEKEEQKKPQEQEPEEEEEEEEEEKSKPNRISITEYGIKSGPAKCPVCTRAFKFFQQPKMKRYFNFKYADLLNAKHRKVADREGFDSMPFFKVRRPGNDKSEFIVGFREIDFEEMMKEITQR